MAFVAFPGLLRLFGIWNSFLQDVQAARKWIQEKEAAARKRPIRRLRRPVGGCVALLSTALWARIRSSPSIQPAELQAPLFRVGTHCRVA